MICLSFSYVVHSCESGLTGENAIKKSSLRRAFDCCATSATIISYVYIQEVLLVANRLLGRRDSTSCSPLNRAIFVTKAGQFGLHDAYR
jgi:hypothetical protein